MSDGNEIPEGNINAAFMPPYSISRNNNNFYCKKNMSNNNFNTNFKNYHNYYSNDESANTNFSNTVDEETSSRHQKKKNNFNHSKSSKRSRERDSYSSSSSRKNSDWQNKNINQNTSFLKKHKRSTSYNTDEEVPNYMEFNNNKKPSTLDYPSNDSNNFLMEEGEVQLEASNNIHLNPPPVKRRLELKDLLQERHNSSSSSDSLSKDSFEEIMESKRNEKRVYSFAAPMDIDENNQTDPKFKNSNKDDFFDFGKNTFNNNFQMNKESKSFHREFSYPKNNKISKTEHNNSNNNITNKLKTACIQFLEKKTYEVENNEEREESREKTIAIEKKITELQKEQQVISEFTTMLPENGNKENTFENIIEVINVPNPNKNNIQDDQIIKITTNESNNLQLSNILPESNNTITVNNYYMCKEDVNEEREPGEIFDDDEIIDINAMNVDDENFNFERDRSNIDMSVTMTVVNDSILSLQSKKSSASLVKMEENIEVAIVSAPVPMKKPNPYALDLYRPYFEEKADPDEEMDSRLKEIEEMMDQIELNEVQKSYMRKTTHEVKIPKIKNKKETYFNNSFLVFFLNTCPLSSLGRKLKNRDFKLNLILDLDSTLIFADADKNIPDNLKDGSHLIQPTINENQYNLRLRLRKYTIEFIQRVSKFSKLYISTHGQEPYAREVVKILNKETGVEIQEENVSAARGQVTYKTLKSFTDDKSFKLNSIIVDDNAKAWEGEYTGNMIQSMKYLSFIPNINFFDKNEKIMKQNENTGKYCFSYTYLLSYNRMQECNDIIQDFKDEFSAPFSLEYDYSKKFQMRHLSDLVENVYKLCVLQNSKNIFLFLVTAEDALRTLKQNVLIGLNINVDFVNLEPESKKVVKEIIILLGGKYESNEKTCTHYIISNTKINEFLSLKSNNPNFRNKKIYCLNLKWLFHCFFFIHKVDENDNEYKMII